MDLTIRPLKVKDRELLTGVCKKLITECRQTWIENIVSLASDKVGSNKPVSGDETAYLQIFTDIIQHALSCYETEMTAWFASLVGMELEQYKEEAPFDADMVILRQIREAPEFRSFFSTACVVFNVKNRFETLLSKMKEKFAFMTDSQSQSLN